MLTSPDTETLSPLSIRACLRAHHLHGPNDLSTSWSSPSPHGPSRPTRISHGARALTSRG